MPSMLLDQHEFLLLRARYHNATLHGDVDIDFGTDGHGAFDIDAGLDRETNPRDQLPFIPRLKIVEIHAIAMDFGPDGMTGAVDKELPVPGVSHNLATGIIDFPPLT